MISKECFTLDWINELSAKFKYNDRILIEKVIFPNKGRGSFSIFVLPK